MEKINLWSCTNNFYRTILTGAIFLLIPAANHAWYKPICYWLHETAACCYFGVDLGKGLDHKLLPRFADGTPYSSSDLLYFNLLLYSDKIILSPNSSSLSSLDKKNLSPSPILQKCSKTFSKCVLAKFQSHFIENFLRKFQIVSSPNSNRISPKKFHDNFKLCLSQIPIAFQQNHSKTIPGGVLDKFQSDLIESFPSQFRIMSL